MRRCKFDNVEGLVKQYDAHIEQLQATIQQAREKGADESSLRGHKLQLATWQRARKMALRVREQS